MAMGNVLAIVSSRRANADILSWGRFAISGGVLVTALGMVSATSPVANANARRVTLGLHAT